jgi:hypothetical protein
MGNIDVGSIDCSYCNNMTLCILLFIVYSNEVTYKLVKVYVENAIFVRWHVLFIYQEKEKTYFREEKCRLAPSLENSAGTLVHAIIDICQKLC